MIHIGMDVHQKSTVFCFCDPSQEKDRRYRLVTRPTMRAAFEDVLRPLQGRCKIAFEEGTQAQWVAAIVLPLAVEVQVANASRIPRMIRDDRKIDFVDAQKPATLLALDQIPVVHLPSIEVSGWRNLIHHRRSLVGARGSRLVQMSLAENGPATHESHVPPAFGITENRESTNGSSESFRN